MVAYAGPNGDLVMSMAIAGLTGITCPEHLFRGSVILQSLFALLSDYDIWQEDIPALTIILITWAMMVVPQSWVLYSRLHLLMPDAPSLGVIK
ncbi:hypothetical protein BJY01DRAFT_252214 [Aspergillus pseudoustus]|uniref:Uncharacterized protein n=1 Tax=Aspergillus pseudoustus TaxID=1810923 RepID=A0ABR4J7N5_9EURO